MDYVIIAEIAVAFIIYKLFYLAFGTLICRFFAKFMPSKFDEILKKGIDQAIKEAKL